MAFEHRPYPKIQKRHDGSRPLAGGTWVATEKIHGANLVVATDGTRDAIGKRKAWLADDEPFFGWQLLRHDLVRAARSIRLALEVSDTSIVRLHGEIFGGAYPHPDVAPVRGMSAVQAGVWYAPDIRFALFDIVVESESTAEFLAHREVETIASNHGLFVVPLLARGPRAELETLPVRYPTRVPALLGLPPVADNIAEGFVLKPDARASVTERLVTKWKIPEFDDARFDESLPFDADAALDAEALSSFASTMINPARIASARSKAGTTEDAVCEEVVLDVLVDLEAAFPRAFRTLAAEDEEALRARLVTLARAYFQSNPRE